MKCVIRVSCLYTLSGCRMMELWFPRGKKEVQFRGELITITLPAVRRQKPYYAKITFHLTLRLLFAKARPRKYWTGNLTFYFMQPIHPKLKLLNLQEYIKLSQQLKIMSPSHPCSCSLFGIILLTFTKCWMLLNVFWQVKASERPGEGHQRAHCSGCSQHSFLQWCPVRPAPLQSEQGSNVSQLL